LPRRCSRWRELWLICSILSAFIGVGFLAIPTLAGSAAYAFAETFAWKEGLDEPLRAARPFYAVLIFSMLLGIAMDYLNINPVKALF
jgi:hypothetical protein